MNDLNRYCSGLLEADISPAFAFHMPKTTTSSPALSFASQSALSHQTLASTPIPISESFASARYLFFVRFNTLLVPFLPTPMCVDLTVPCKAIGCCTVLRTEFL